MSETDDTDELLLIPPDIFVPEVEVIQNYGNGPYYNIVDSLIQQVNTLQTRVNSIESCDLQDSSFERTMNHSLKYKSSDDILRDGYNNSTLSTPQKPRTRYKMNTSSPKKNVGKFTLSRFSPQKYSCNDNAHSNDDSNDIHSHSIASSTVAIDNDVVTVNGKVINLAEIENMLEEIELQKKKTELRLREKENAMQQQHVHRMGDDEKSLPNYLTDKQTSLTKTWSGKELSTTSTEMEDKSSISSSDSSQLTTRHVPLNNNRRTRIYENITVGDAGHDFSPITERNMQLLSLRDLWDKKDQTTHGNWKDKLEEEKLRRQHCEEMIQELQTRSLELEERLAVAVQVDKAKDKALLKFYSNWEKFSSGLKNLSDENVKLEKEINEINIRNLEKMDQCNMKLKQYEEETSKALSLAHCNHDKLNTYHEVNQQLKEKIDVLEKQVKQVGEHYESEQRKVKQLNEIIIQKELDLSQNKQVLSDSRNEVATCKKTIEVCQEEFCNIKAQYSQLDKMLSEKRATIKELEAKVANLVLDNDNLKILHKDAQVELQSAAHKMEKTKAELREFYQEQVELLVQEKLKEFQMQLNKAEAQLAEEIRKRELSIAKTAATHIQQITEKHNLEIKLLEEKQKEENKYYQMQLQQAQQFINSLQAKIKHFQERRTNLTHQLHKVMEVQWLEALKIINNTKSPYNDTPADSTLDQLKNLKAKSYSNIEEVLSDPETSNDVKFHGFQQQFPETPLTSKVKTSVKEKDSNELQKYVQMLLPSTSNVSETFKDQPKTEDTDKSTSLRKGLKPPWK